MPMYACVTFSPLIILADWPFKNVTYRLIELCGHSNLLNFQSSLMMTIIGLAQDFVGSNNLNLLQPQGQFGTRLHGGKDSASPRYIFTMLRSVICQQKA